MIKNIGGNSRENIRNKAGKYIAQAFVIHPSYSNRLDHVVLILTISNETRDTDN